MVNFFKKKPKIEFVSINPSVTQLMPIEPAKNVSRVWLKKVIKDFKKQLNEIKESNNNPSPRHTLTNISKCPGIISVMKNGWIQKTWMDLYIQTDGDGVHFNWSSPIDQSTLDLGHDINDPYVGYHSPEMYCDYNPDKNTLRSIVKIFSPWIVYIPKGYYLLNIPIPYPDRHEFTSSVGLLDPDNGPNFLNVQLFWHELNKEVFIPAGTPLAQYFLIKKEIIDFEIREYNKNDIDNLKLKSMAKDSTFIPSYKKWKAFKFK